MGILDKYKVSSTKTPVNNTGASLLDKYKVSPKPTVEEIDKITPTGKKVDGIPTVTIEQNTPTVDKTISLTQAPNKQTTPFFGFNLELPIGEKKKEETPEQKVIGAELKKFGFDATQDIDNPNNIYAQQKAMESFHNLKSVIDKSSDEEVASVAGQTSDFILSKKLSVRKDLDKVDSQINEFIASTASKYKVYNAEEDKYLKDLYSQKKYLQDQEKSINEDLNSYNQFFQQERLPKLAIGYNPEFQEAPEKFLQGFDSNKAAKLAIETGIKLTNTGNLVNERANLDNAFSLNLSKFAGTDGLFSDFAKLYSPVPYPDLDKTKSVTLDYYTPDDNYKMSAIDRETYLLEGSKLQQKAIKESIDVDKQNVAQLDEIKKEIIAKIGNNTPTKETQDYLSNLDKQKELLTQRIRTKAIIESKFAELSSKTSYLDKQKEYDNKWSFALDPKKFQEYAESTDLPYKLKEVISGLGLISHVGTSVVKAGIDLADKVTYGIPSYIERGDLRSAVENKEITPEQERAINLARESRHEQDFADLGIIKTPTYFKDNFGNQKQLLGFNEKGFYINPEMAVYEITKTTGESLMLGSPAIATEGLIANQAVKKLFQAGSMVFTSEIMLGDEMVRNFEKQGLSSESSYLLGKNLARLEGFTESFFIPETKLFSRFVGEGVENLTEDQIKQIGLKNLTRELGLKEGVADVFGKYLTIKNKWVNGAISKTQAVAEMGKLFTKTTLSEYKEELVGDILTPFIEDYVAGKDASYNPESKSAKEFLQDQVTSLLTVAITMSPTAAITARSEYQDYKDKASYIISQNPEYYIKLAKKDFDKGAITQEELVKQYQAIKTAEITNMLSKPEFDYIDKSNLNDAEKDKLKIQVYSANNKIEDLKTQLNRPLLEADKNKIIEQIAKLSEEKINNINSANKSTEQVFKEKEQAEIKAINAELSDENISTLSQDKAVSYIQALITLKSYNTSEELNKVYTAKIEKLTKTLEEKQEVTKSLFDQEQEKIKNLTESEIEDYEVPTEISSEDRKKLLLLKRDRATEIETKQNTVTFKDSNNNSKDFQLGDLVTYQGANYIVKRDENNVPYLENDITKARVKPSDVNDFEEYTPKSNTTTTEEEIEPIDTDLMKEFGIAPKPEIVQEETTQEPSADSIEAKKADIERRRPTSYIRDSKDKKSPLETFRNEAKREWDGVSVITGDRMKNLYVGIQLFVEAYPEHKDLLDKFIKKENGTIGITNNNLSFVLNTLKKQGVTTESELGVKINAKYDAEIAALTKQEPKPTVSEEADVAKKADIERRRQDVREAIQKAGKGEGGQFIVTLIDGSKENAVRISLVGNELGVGNKGVSVDLSIIKKVENPDGTILYDAELKALEKVEEPVEVIEQKVTQEEIKNQEKVIKAEEKKEKEEKKETVKQNKDTEAFATYYPLSTIAPKPDEVLNDVLIKTSLNSLLYLKSEMQSTGKSLSDLGYYISVHDVRDFPEYQFFNAWEDYWKNNKKQGLVAVITNKNGDIQYFTEEGLPSNSSEGLWSIHQVKKNVNQPKDLPAQRLEEWKKDKEKLERLREFVKIEKPAILESTIKSATPTEARGTIAQNFTDYTFVIGKDNYIKLANGETYQIYGKKTKLGNVEGISGDIFDFLNLNNSEGLPEEYQVKENDGQSLLKTFENRLKTKTFPEIFYYGLGRYKFFLNLETKEPYITTKEKTDFKVEGRENVIEFLNNAQINLSKSLEKSPFVTVYKLKDGKFEKEQVNYKEIVANNFEVVLKTPVGTPHFVFERAIKKEETPVETTPQVVVEEPALEQTQAPIEEQGLQFNFDNISFAQDSLDNIEEEQGLDRAKTLLQKVTKEQEAQAKEWFDNYLSKSGAEYEDSRNIASSTAFATWKKGVITLWKDSKYTDFYHEAFHDFSQFFLTKKQKEALYKEAENTLEGKLAISNLSKKLNKKPQDLTKLEKYFALEEMLAEDFYKYMLSGQKYILSNRVKRNSIFRKIYNFLKELFTGNPSIETVYSRLAKNKVNKAQRDPSKALFGTLNKAFQGLKTSDSLSLNKAIDSIIASKIIEKQTSISRIFLEKNYLDKAYGSVKNELLKTATNLLADFKKSPTSELGYSLTNLQFVLNNWDKIKVHHKNTSEFLKVSKELIPDIDLTEEGDEIEINDKYGDARENVNPKDNVAMYIMYMIASLPKYQYKDGKLIPSQNKFIPEVQDTVDFSKTWSRLAKELQGDKDYNSMYAKIEKLAKENYTYSTLLSLIPDPNKQLDRYELQLKASFINAFSKPLIPSRTTSFEYTDGRINIQSRVAEPISNEQLKQDWSLSIQIVPSEYREKDSSGQYYINTNKILDSFKTLGESNAVKFLESLGITLSKGTVESAEFKNLVKNTKKIETIKQRLKEYKFLQDGQYPSSVVIPAQQLDRLSKPITSPINQLAKSIYSEDGKNLFEGLQDIFNELLTLELKYSEDYSGDTAKNSEGNSKWLHKDWSLQSQDYSLLNNVEKFPTYYDLIADDLGKYYDIDLNPDANNIFLNSLFILDVPKTEDSYGTRRLGLNNKPVQIELFDQDGIRISKEQERDGLKTSRLPRYLALIADLPTFLLSGEKQHLRYGDKSTSRGTLIRYPSFVRGEIKVDKHLPVDITDFKNPNILSKQAWTIFKNSLASTLQITNDQTANKAYDDVANIAKNIKKSPFGKYDKILSNSTKELLKEAHSENAVNVSNLIDKYKEEISKDLTEYFKKDTEKLLEELDSNPLITPKDIFPDKLFPRFSKEQLVSAFSMNTWIINSEHERLIFQDQRMYDIKIDNESKANYREPFKRYSKSTSTGVNPINDFQTNSFFNNLDSNSFAEKATYDKNNPDNPSLPYVEEGIVNSFIVDDVKITPEDYTKSLLSHLKNAPQEEQDAVKGALEGIKVTDAMAVCTFDFYRNLKLRIGEESWSDEAEKLYQKIARGEQLTEEDNKNSYLFFPPFKFRVTGRTFNGSKFIPIDYKFAITPLLPTLVEGKTYEDVKNNMIRQNAHLMLFQSASKHSATTDGGKYNKLYNEDGSAYTGDYTFNKVPIEYFYEVVNAPEDYKEQVSFSTQLRTLLFVNLFDNGKPQDFRKSKKEWESLSEQEKLKQSKAYRNASNFRDAVDNLVKLKKEQLLNQIEAVYNPTTDSYTFNQKALSELLEKEFDSKQLPINVQQSIATNVKDEFKYMFDATIARDEIENTLLSVIDNRLRKQKVFGESLIQVSSAGFEEKGKVVSDSSLPFYKDLGRTKKDGTKVTSAHKIKIPLQGDFKKLLQHPDVLQLSSKNKISPLKALNQLIRDEEWLDKGDNRKFVTITGVRIPVQGLNSMEFMEVYEFFPSESGNIIAVAPELVAKSGGDFDWDKITSQFPHIHYNSYTKKLKVYSKQYSSKKGNLSELKELRKSNHEVLNSLYEESKAVNDAVQEYKKDRDGAKLAKSLTKETINNIDSQINELRNVLDILEGIYQESVFSDNVLEYIKSVSDDAEIDFSTRDLIISAVEKTISNIENKIDEIKAIKSATLPIFENMVQESRYKLSLARKEQNKINLQLESLRKNNSFISEFIFENSPEKAAQNELIDIMRDVLEDPNNFVNLMLPNATYMFEPIADQRKNALETEKPGYSDNYTATESLNQHESNFVGKDALGIGAIFNKVFPMMQQVGLYLNDTYITNLDYQTPRYTRNRFKHNTTQEGNISVSGVWSVEKPGKGRYKISESISQLMNGWLDVAKKDWVFYINGRKELAPTMLFHLAQGTHKDDVISFFNQPVLYDYIKLLNTYKNPLTKAVNPEVYKNAKKEAMYNTLMKYIPSNLEIDVKRGKKIVSVNLREELQDKYKGETQFFYGFINNQLRQLADKNEDLFDSSKFDYNKFSFPTDGKIEKPTTDRDKLAQVVYFIQYLELEEQQKLFSEMRRTLNNDTSKASSLQYSRSRQTEQLNTELKGLFPIDLVKKMANNSTISAFTNESTGIDKFIKQFSKNLFDITNNEEFNKFVEAEWSKPQSNTYDKDGQLMTLGNYISFDNRNQDTKDEWLRTFKNDFLLYLYDNNVEDEQGNLVARKVRQWMSFETSLAHELESLKRDFPDLTKNNLFLDYLVKDYSKLGKDGKPTYTNIKLKFDKLDKDNSDILAEDFLDLLEFKNPTYTPEQQIRIKNFASDLSYFAYVQSGLNKTPFYLIKYIPQDYFAGKMQPVIQKTKEIFDTDPSKAKEILNSFNGRFRSNNRKFYTQEYDENVQPILTFNNDSARFKPYVNTNLDLFNKNKEKEEQELRDKTSVVPTFQANEAVENPKTLFVYGDSEDKKATNNSAKITLVKKNNSFQREKLPNIFGLTLLNSRENYLSDEQFTQNQQVIDEQIKQIKDISKQYSNIKFSEDLFLTSQLSEKAPITANYIISNINLIFGTNYPLVPETDLNTEEQTPTQVVDRNDTTYTFQDYARDNKGKEVTVKYDKYKQSFTGVITGNTQEEITGSDENGEYSYVGVEVKTNTGKLVTANPFYEITGNVVGKEKLTNESNKIYKNTKQVVDSGIDKSKKINIYAGTGENADLSNFAIRPFTIAGDEYQSVEQYFQLQKFQIAGVLEFDYDSPNAQKIANEISKIADEISKTSNGAKLKSLGGKRILGTKLNEEFWKKVGSEEMKKAMLASFKQNPNALQKLLATGKAELTHKYNNVEQDKGRFSRLLMEVRQELKPNTVNNKDTQAIDKNEIYSQLGNKTKSGNVVIKSWGELKDATKAITSQGIISTRIPNTNEHFGNPFSHDPAGKTKGLIKTETVKEAVEKFIDWVINSRDLRAEWIRKQLKSGELKNKPVLYYKELGEPSHATALDYLINKYDWNNKTVDKNQLQNIKKGVNELFEQTPELSKIGTLQQYSQYLDSLSKPNTNPILQGSKQEQVKKFAELQERLNNKEFLEGAKSAYASTPALQELGTQEEYNDYIARVSLGIIKNPSSGGYNYASQVKDIVYHGTKYRAKLYNEKPLVWFNDINDNEAYFIYEDTYDIKNKIRLSYEDYEKLPQYRFEKFKKKEHRYAGGDTFLGTGIYFTTSKEDANKGYNREGLYSAIIDVKNPYTENKGYSNSRSGKGSQELIDKGYDSVTEKINNGQEYNVFEPEQIHILSSKQDIENFAKFVKNSKLGNVKDMENYMNSKSVDYIMDKLIQSGKIEKRC